MEDKLIRLQIARTGVFGANGSTITRQNLQDVVDTFDGKGPISLGHYMAKQDWWPSWGNVENLMLEQGEGEDATLVADISVRSVLWDAIKEGFYPGWSVSIPERASDGKRYLHHLAFLGSMPPAIRDLNILKTADGDEIPKDAIKVQGEQGFSFDDIADYSKTDFSDEPKEITGGEGGDPEDEPPVAETPPADPEPKQEKPVENEFADKGNKAIEKARKIYSSSVKASLDAAVEGKLPAGMKDKLHEFADLALESYDFADEAEEPRIITLFKEIVASMKSLPKPGRTNFSDVPLSSGNETKIDRAALARKF